MATIIYEGREYTMLDLLKKINDLESAQKEKILEIEEQKRKQEVRIIGLENNKRMQDEKLISLETKNEKIIQLESKVTTLQEQLNKAEDRIILVAQNSSDNSSSLILMNSIPKFSGKFQENIYNFFQKVEQAQAIGGWDVNKTLLIAKQLLEGEALTFVGTDMTAKEVKSYDEFKKIMIDRFKCKNTARYYRELLNLIQIQSDESIEQYADRIRAINIHTYELTDNNDKNEAVKYEADQRALDSFMRGLGESMLATRVRTTCPESFNKAVSTAIAFNEAQRSAKFEAQNIANNQYLQTANSAPEVMQLVTQPRVSRPIQQNYSLYYNNDYEYQKFITNQSQQNFADTQNSQITNHEYYSSSSNHKKRRYNNIIDNQSQFIPQDSRNFENIANNQSADYSDQNRSQFNNYRQEARNQQDFIPYQNQRDLQPPENSREYSQPEFLQPNDPRENSRNLPNNGQNFLQGNPHGHGLRQTKN
jgi:flavodoxin